ncbi:MAG: PQQ-dependent sugar dehydrogenase [Cyclobacteriaceae bacterium]|nr:PQQ-dependent sugar dehydrogenase [Cyclobacteriaceae bacterium]
MLRNTLISLTLILFGYSSFAQPTYSEAFPGITFTAPIELLTPPDQSKRLFLVQQNGIIKVLPNKKNLMPGDVKNFLIIPSPLITGGERGLLGMAFHPDFESNGYFYVNYTRSGPLTSVISRFSVKTENPNEADPFSELILLTQSQPFDNHNGGKLAFGTDGYLYISIGDGGSGGDPQNNAQNLTNLLGKILRIDVNASENGLPYAIPSTNPFKGNTNGYREEIFAYGLRNVWKFSVDQVTGNIWAADVGQGAREEINLITGGKNYGWRLMEGTLCYNPATNCNPGDLVLPIFEYPHQNNNRSITGGFVYRGVQIPEWNGQYLYGDYISGRTWKLNYVNNIATNEFLLTSGGFISSFGEDHNGEPYVLHYSAGNTGRIYRFFPSAPQAPSALMLQHNTTSNQLTWTDESNNELGFIIERSSATEIAFETMDTVTYNTTEYTDVVNNAEAYTYRVKAYNDGGESDYAYAENVVVSLSELLNTGITVFPNPTANEVHISFPTYYSEATNISIINVMTQTIESVTTMDTKVTFNLENQSPGFYLVEIKNRVGKTTRKLIIK